MFEIQVTTVNATRKQLQQLEILSHDKVRQMYGNAWHEHIVGRVKAHAVWSLRDEGPRKEYLLVQAPNGSAILVCAFNQEVARDLYDLLVI